MTEIRIPTSVEEAARELGALGALLTAKEWQRAAIVAAFVEVSDGPGKRNVSSDISPATFAALKIVGLRSTITVRTYAEAWRSTGRPRPKPGEIVNLDGLPAWPPASSTVDAVKRNTRAVAAALADPDTLHQVIAKLDPYTLRLVLEVVLAQQEPDPENDPTERNREKKPTDYGRLVERAVNDLSICLTAARNGKWEITGLHEALLYFATQLLGERRIPEGEHAAMVNQMIDDLENYANAGAGR